MHREKLLKLQGFANCPYVLGLTLCAAACATRGDGPSPSGPERVPTSAAEAVRQTEIAFAQTMADRDFAAFVSHLSDEAVFFGEPAITHGATETAAAWKRYFAGPEPPFAWMPDHIEVLKSGTLALSTGLVTVGGKVVGRFNSIWRLEDHHQWRIVFDRGAPVCGATSGSDTTQP
jgi:ketosteroid isomerase-like protein